MEIAGIVKNSFVDYPGKIATTIFTCGCNMNCWYCHNRDIITSTEGEYDADKILAFIRERKGFLDGVVISGGEPTLQKDLKDFIAQVKDIGLAVKLDTNGTNPDLLKELIDEKLIDYVAMDIKAPYNKYNIITKIDNIDDVKKSVDILKTSGIKHEFRTTYAPNLHEEDILKLLEDIGPCENYSLQQYKKPSFITNDLLEPHKPSEFEQIKSKAGELVKNFVIKNI